MIAIKKVKNGGGEEQEEAKEDDGQVQHDHQHGAHS